MVPVEVVHDCYDKNEPLKPIKETLCGYFKVDVKSIVRVGSAQNKGKTHRYKNCLNFVSFELFLS